MICGDGRRAHANHPGLCQNSALSHPHASSQTTAAHRDISGWTVWADFGWWRASHFSVMRSGLGRYCQADWGVQLMDVLDGVLWDVYADTHCLRVPF